MSKMRREDEGKVKVGVAIETLWIALTKEITSVVPLTIPEFVTDLQLLEGDGGNGTIYLFKFTPDAMNKISYQKEKIVDFDESIHQVGLEVIEGGRLDCGYTYYRSTFQLTEIGESETLVNVKVETECDEYISPEDRVRSGVAYIKSLEGFLLKNLSNKAD